jgi:glycerophosphoryl diester phosphodiesterase
MKIVAHRGICDTAPENTIPAFKRAVELGADAVELDVRLTADQVPVVFHDTNLERLTSSSGPVSKLTLEQIRKIRFRHSKESGAGIPTFREVLDAVGGRIGVQIELKGPDPETPKRIGVLLQDFKPAWDTLEVISFDPVLLAAYQEISSGPPTGLLTIRREIWLPTNIAARHIIQRMELARTRAVHLHASQLSQKLVEILHDQGIDVHAWGVNNRRALSIALRLGISSVCTDRFREIAGGLREAAGRIKRPL